MSAAHDAARVLGESLALAPQDARLRFHHAQALKAVGDVNGAVRTLAAGVQLAPHEAERWLALAGLLMEIELASPDRQADRSTSPLARAVDVVDQALILAPSAPAALAQAAMTLRYACAWERARACVAALVDAARDPERPLPVSPMMAAALIDDPALQRRAIRDFVAQTMPQVMPRATAPAFVEQRGSALRVGYLSADFHEHATAHLIAGLFEAHDKRRVTTFGYALDSDDGSAMRTRLARAFDHWRELREADDTAAATSIAADALDVLVDLKGHTQGSRIGILARRPAPRQIHYLGFPGTLAHAAIDAQVADAIVVPPENEQHFAERVLRLPQCYQVNDRKRPLPPTLPRAQAGLPERGLVLVCFNQTYKLAPEFFSLWLEVLARNDDAVLWLNVPHALARHNLRTVAEARRVKAERIVFAPFAKQADHLARLRCADLALDVLPYGSHTTGSDALWCGVPLLTLTGATFAGRVGTSLVHAVGLPGLAVASLDDYRETLLALAVDRERLEAYKTHLERERYSVPLFDTERFTRDFEHLLEAAADAKGVREFDG